MMKLLLLGVFLIEGITGMTSDWPDGIFTGEDCLTYDGSRVPDCSDFIDPQIKQPYYHPHSENCSRFWECGPNLETCLFECASCPEGVQQCQGQQALTFDPKYKYPDGPVCDWPNNVECTNTGGECDCLPWQHCVGGKCSPQCEEDSHCPAGYSCSDCKWCEGLKCSSDNECKHDKCDAPTNPHTTCEYCDSVSDGCVPGCPDDSLCPSNYPVCGHGGGPHLCGCSEDMDCAGDEICNIGTHECNPRPIDVGCDGDNTNCLIDMCDEPNWPYNTCEYCDDTVCREGCPDNSKCPESTPICGANGQPHRCGCNLDSDCPSNLPECDLDANVCYKPECSEDTDCTPNEICDVQNIPEYLNCQYCEDGHCKPGCIDNTHCPTGYECSNRICDQTAGKTLLKSIKIHTASCSGCSNEGLTVTLHGTQAVVSKVQCTTNTLDHNGELDFATGGSSVFNKKITLGLYNPDGGCLNAPLDAVISDSTFKWEGSGTWQGESICVEWMGDDNYAVTCKFVGDTITDCSNLQALTCP